MTWSLFLVLLLSVAPSLVISWSAAWLVCKRAATWGLVDRPGGRKDHRAATPMGGGLAIWLGLVVPFAVGHLLLVLAADPERPSSLAPWAASLPGAELIGKHFGGLQQKLPDLWFLLGMGTVLMVLGLIDDLRGLNWRLRLMVEVCVAAGVVAYGWKVTLFLDYPWLTSAITVAWIVGLVNSFNMLDNMDGLSGGVAAIAAAMLAAVLLLAPDPETQQPQLFVAGFLIALVGSVVGFLLHNRPPARLFMGDAGSYLLGYCLAAASILATFTGGHLPKHAILAPLCVLAVPLYDTCTVIWIRLRAGRSPFEGDKNHLSHRLVQLGMSKAQAVLTIYLLTATCGLGALLLHEVDSRGAWIIVLLIGCVLTLVGLLEAAGRSSGRKRK